MDVNVLHLGNKSTYSFAFGKIHCKGWVVSLVSVYAFGMGIFNFAICYQRLIFIKLHFIRRMEKERLKWGVAVDIRTNGTVILLNCISP
jgi:hypothetical protein